MMMHGLAKLQIDPEYFELKLKIILLIFNIPLPHSSTEGMRCSILVYDLPCHPLWCSRTIVSESVHVSSVTCTVCFLLYIYALDYSLAVCLSLEYTQNIYHHILKMDCALGSERVGRSFNCSIQIHF
jgi:hypothetical protein